MAAWSGHDDGGRICPLCRGRGKLVKPAIRCSACQGAGVVHGPQFGVARKLAFALPCLLEADRRDA